jgi:uncharacterized protein
MELIGTASYLLLSVAVFSGALISGLTGFAGSAVSGAFILYIFPHLEAVPLMMTCSLGVHAANVLALDKHLQWKESASLIIGGLVGTPIAVYFLLNVDTQTFRVSFGIVVAFYAAYALLRPTIACLRHRRNYSRNILIGFCGGLIGGLTAMPGALPTIWCDMSGMPKMQQRGLVQPFIVSMQAFALILLISQNSLSPKLVVDFVLCLPALMAGTTVGIMMFGRVNELAIKRVVLTVLLFSGLSSVIWAGHT